MKTAVVASILAAGTASADVLTFMSDPASSSNAPAITGAAFSGSMDYDSGTGVLLLTIQNDSAVSTGGYITGIVFNIDSADASASAALQLPLPGGVDPDWEDTGSESASPFGTFDAGVALDANWTGGGQPSRGLAIGDSATFTFQVSAADSGSLSAINFITTGPDANPAIAVRFRGLDTNPDSDKLLNTPTPGAVALAGLAGLMGARRRR